MNVTCQVTLRIHVPSWQKPIEITETVDVSKLTVTRSPIADRLALISRLNPRLEVILNRNIETNTLSLRFISTDHLLNFHAECQLSRPGYRQHKGQLFYFGGDGTFRPPSVHHHHHSHFGQPQGQMQHHCFPIVSFSGHISFNSHSVHIRDGMGIYTHAIHTIPLHQSARQWHLFLLVDFQSRSILHQLWWRLPDGYDPATPETSVGGCVLNDQLVFTSHHNHVQVHQYIPDPPSAHSLPYHVSQYWQTGPSQGWSAQSTVTLYQPLIRQDLLHQIPVMVRKWVARWMQTRPWLFHWVEQGVEAVISTPFGEAVSIRGTALVESILL